MSQTFLILTHHIDAGHGWVEASAKLIDQLGILNQITEYSYYSHTEQKYYLEEDCDAGVLIDALKGIGQEFVFRSQDHGDEFRKLNRLARVGCA